ncbi:PTS transporter subunit EIIC [Thorsellia kenyensis]|uniref:PTS transporter subunit EIIC n=1 Tax=Thorsellia kenyensis TaxID=1549888 RepID=A0ABV6CA12_9GAMM
MAKDYQTLVKEIITLVGGNTNINSVVHCATRLRFNLKQTHLANIDAIKDLKGVLTAVLASGQFQIVIGNEVPEVYVALTKELALSSENHPHISIEDSVETKKKSIGSRLIDTISGVFAPVLGVMCASGLLKGIIAILMMKGVLIENSGTHLILNAVSDALFFFLPVLLGYSAAKTFGGNVFISMVLGGALIHPAVRGSVIDDTNLEFLFFKLTLIDYASSVLPIILAAYVSAHLERLFSKILPQAIKNFIGPMLVLLIVGPLTFLLIGPVANFLSFKLASGYQAVYSFSPVLGGGLIGALWQPLVIFGLHWSFIPIILNDYATVKTSFLDPMTQIAVMGQVGAAFGLLIRMLMTKDKVNSGLTASATLSGVFGITEPIIYGLTLPRKSPFVMGIIASACGGAIAGLLGVKGYTFSALGIFFLASTISPEGIGASFNAAVIGTCTAFGIGALLTVIFYRPKNKNKL